VLVRADFQHRSDPLTSGESSSVGPTNCRILYYSLAYSACPNLADQRQLLALLDASRIGVELSDEDQLWPEQSTSAIVLHHPQARYFNV
jgi:cobalamin-dependent methionine synthase I